MIGPAQSCATPEPQSLSNSGRGEFSFREQHMTANWCSLKYIDLSNCTINFGTEVISTRRRRGALNSAAAIATWTTATAPGEAISTNSLDGVGNRMLLLWGPLAGIDQTFFGQGKNSGQISRIIQSTRHEIAPERSPHISKAFVTSHNHHHLAAK